MRLSWWHLTLCSTLAAVMVAGALGMSWPVPAIAQRDRPTPEELWQAYPLDPEGERKEEKAPRGTTGPRPTPTPTAPVPTPIAPTPTATAPAREDDGGLPTAALLGAVLVAFAGGLTAGQMRRRRLAAAARAAIATTDDVVTTAAPPPPEPEPEPEEEAPKPRFFEVEALEGTVELELAVPEPVELEPPEIELPEPEPLRAAPEPEPETPGFLELETLEPEQAALELVAPEPVEPEPPDFELPEPTPLRPVPPPPEPEPEPAPPEPEPAPPAPEPAPPAPEPAPPAPEPAPHEPEPAPPAPEPAPHEPEAAPPRAVPAEPEFDQGEADEYEYEYGEPAVAAVEEDPGWLPSPRFARAEQWSGDEDTWTCEIAWKAGYIKSCFRAMAAPPGSSKRRSIGESSQLKWTLMMDPEPPTPDLVAAVRELVEALEEAGWERTDPGGPWYALRFLWHGEGRPQRVETSGHGALTATEETDE